MNGKRHFENTDDVQSKKAKSTDSRSKNHISLEYNPTLNDEYNFNDASSHGGPTFRAIEEDDESLSFDYGIDCLDDFDDANRQPVAGCMDWIQQHIFLGTDPKLILQSLLPSSVTLPENMDALMMWKLILDMLTDPKPREKLPHINTLDHAIHLLATRKNILVLTGAGVSVSCGIPDFRSRNGIYARLSEEYPDLPDPQAMFDINYFRCNTHPFYKFAREIYPGKFKPSLSHRFIKQLERNDILLRNYTQNIDTLEREAGICRVIECHGSFSTASCTNCHHKVTSNDIREDILNQVTPLCSKCPVLEDTLSVMKPDIVFFGESLPKVFHDHVEKDIKQVDLLIVIGSSLKVRPVNLIPNQIPAEVPQILINREPLPHMNFDIELLGNCDAIIAHLCKELGGDWCDVLEGFEVPTLSQDVLLSFSSKCIKSQQDALKSKNNEQQNAGKLKNSEKQDVGKSKNNEQQDVGKLKNIEQQNAGKLKNSEQLDVGKLKNSEQLDVGKSKNREQQVDGSLNSEIESSSLSIPHKKENKEITFIFHPPSRYIFHGADIGQCQLSDDNDEDPTSTETLSRDYEKSDGNCTKVFEKDNASDDKNINTLTAMRG
ncbi:NAD-dependent protein deacetylase sirtuin-1-like [Xenia sp. Carnegie-2017]|uniref:NAD-dependent protein deacetylase sirtuin-1-like n=1 Tax=Xenia sp. Carnegie-2017 TaxID=2897299 RepID=UPI001F0484D9|nr:NAD-dependent protein deacetylase sirtuin-1-like [Xenia sp. Carnegie-2017]